MQNEFLWNPFLALLEITVAYGDVVTYREALMMLMSKSGWSKFIPIMQMYLVFFLMQLIFVFAV